MDKNKKNENNCRKDLKDAEKDAARTEEKLEDKKEELKTCEGEKDDWERKAGDYYDQLLRLKADFENYRKRNEKEKPELIKWGKYELILKIFPLYDMLISAHNHVINMDVGKCSKEQIDSLIKGLDMVFAEFSKSFEAEGIRPMELLNKPYDPMLCEIIGIVEGDEKNDGLVVEEFQKGYMIESKVLRPAKVKIAKKKTAEQPPAEEKKEEGK